MALLQFHIGKSSNLTLSKVDHRHGSEKANDEPSIDYFYKVFYIPFLIIFIMEWEFPMGLDTIVHWYWTLVSNGNGQFNRDEDTSYRI